MSGHTPGPWIAHMLGGGKGGPNSYYISTAIQDGVMVNVASAHANYGQPAGWNARLIAAAPDLLEALEALLVPLDGAIDAGGLVAKARAAVAKARGEK